MKKSICVILAVVLTTLMVSAQQYHHPRYAEGGTEHFNFSHPDSLDNGFNFPGDPTPHSKLNPNLKRKNTPSVPNEVIYLPKVVTVDTLTYFYTYDAKGNLISKTFEGFIFPYYRDTYTYDSNGNMLTDLFERYSNGSWVPDYRSTYTYDSNGNQLTELDENYTNGSWVPNYRYTYTYDSNGNMLTELAEYYTNSSWVTNWRYTFTYDSNGNMLTELLEDYTNGSWVTHWRYTFTYDSNGNMLSKKEFALSGGPGGMMVPKNVTNYTYDSNGNLLVDFNSIYDGFVTVVPYKRFTYTYDGFGNRLTTLFEEYRRNNSRPWEGSSWVPVYRTTCTYDNSGNLLTNLLEINDSNQGGWYIRGRITYIFSNNNCTSSFYEAWNGSAWIKDYYSADFKIYYNNGKNYLSYYAITVKVEYISITLATSDPNALPETITLNQNYPNPFNPATAITFSLPSESFTSLKVYNTLGEHVQTLVNGVLQSGVHNISFDATSLPSGVYVYRLEAGDVSISKKMMLMK